MLLNNSIDELIENYSYYNKVIGNFLIEYKECQGKFPETNKEDALVFVHILELIYDINFLIEPILKEFVEKNRKEIP